MISPLVVRLSPAERAGLDGKAAVARVSVAEATRLAIEAWEPVAPPIRVDREPDDDWMETRDGET